MRDYFPITLTKTADFDPNKNYIMAVHPHGIMSASAYLNFATEATGWSEKFPGIKSHPLTLASHFRFPLHRDIVMLSGACSVSRESCVHILTKQGNGNAIQIVIGGAAEALDAHPGTVSLVLKRRKGFVRLALQHGASLVPVFSFGENELYQLVGTSRIRQFQDWATRLIGVAPVVFHGRGMFQYTMGLLPYRKPVNTVVGKPIEVEKNTNPSQEDVDRLHERYITSLIELFDQYKGQFGAPYKDLTIKVT
jgi:hypothetical protein